MGHVSTLSGFYRPGQAARQRLLQLRRPEAVRRQAAELSPEKEGVDQEPRGMRTGGQACNAPTPMSWRRRRALSQRLQAMKQRNTPWVAIRRPTGELTCWLMGVVEAVVRHQQGLVWRDADSVLADGVELSAGVGGADAEGRIGRGVQHLDEGHWGPTGQKGASRSLIGGTRSALKNSARPWLL